MLNRIRQYLGISEERATELEASLKPQLTEDEQEYLDMYREYAESGEITEKMRRRLDKFAAALGFSSNRQQEIEKTLSLGKFALEKIFSTNSVEKEKELVAALIKEGKDKGVDEMEIDVNNRRGFDFNIPIEGIDIKTMVGANEKMRIKVKYK